MRSLRDGVGLGGGRKRRDSDPSSIHSSFFHIVMSILNEMHINLSANASIAVLALVITDLILSMMFAKDYHMERRKIPNRCFISSVLRKCRPI